MPWWGWLLAWIVVALAVGVVLGKVIRHADRRELAHPQRWESADDPGWVEPRRVRR